LLKESPDKKNPRVWKAYYLNKFSETDKRINMSVEQKNDLKNEYWEKYVRNVYGIDSKSW